MSTNLAGHGTKAGGVAFTTLAKLLQIPYIFSRQSRTVRWSSLLGQGGWCWGAGRARAKQAAVPAVPACSPALPPHGHHCRPCRSPPDVCSGKKLSTQLAKAILRAAGNVQKARSALACWDMPVLLHGDPTAQPESAVVPTWLGKQLSSCSSRPGGKLVLPRAPCPKDRAANVL